MSGIFVYGANGRTRTTGDVLMTPRETPNATQVSHYITLRIPAFTHWPLIFTLGRIVAQRGWVAKQSAPPDKLANPMYLLGLLLLLPLVVVTFATTVILWGKVS